MLLNYYLEIILGFACALVYGCLLFWTIKKLKIKVQKKFRLILCTVLSVVLFLLIEIILEKWLHSLPSVMFALHYLLLPIIVKIVFELKFKKAIEVALIWNSMILLTFFLPIRIVSHKIVDVGICLGDSMADTLNAGDVILEKKYYYGYSLFKENKRFLEFHDPQRGDILEILAFVRPDNRKFFIVKRCIAIPGDVLEIKNKVLYLNGAPQREPYVKHIDPKILPAKKSQRDNFGPVTIRKDCRFVMGDNRDDSWDSRNMGQMEDKWIIGKVELLERGTMKDKVMAENALKQGH